MTHSQRIGGAQTSVSILLDLDDPPPGPSADREALQTWLDDVAKGLLRVYTELLRLPKQDRRAEPPG